MTNYHSIKKLAEELGVPLEKALGEQKQILQRKIRFWVGIIQEAKKEVPPGTLEEKLAENHINEAIKELKRLEWECTKLNPAWIESQGLINKETIAQAKAYPISGLLPYTITHNMTRCPFHEDRHPSATVKGNFFWCFVCNVGFDSIGLVMKLNGLTFKEAILTLSGA